MRRVYRHYAECEEFQPGGMWRIVTGIAIRDEYVQATAVLMADPDRFREAMFRVVREWPNSVEVQMTTPSLNRRAWFGHAGCFLATESPEDCTRLGWHMLGPDQQRAANAAADDAIAKWERTYVPRGQASLFEAAVLNCNICGESADQPGPDEWWCASCAQRGVVSTDA